MPTFYQIEEKQRADARERKEKGIEWQQKVGRPTVFVNVIVFLYYSCLFHMVTVGYTKTTWVID